MDSKAIDHFFINKPPLTRELYDYFIKQFLTIAPVTIHPAKTMIGIATPRKRIAYVTQFGKSFIHVVFPFDQAYEDNLCFQKVAKVPDDSKQFNHHFRMLSKEDVNSEVKKIYEACCSERKLNLSINLTMRTIASILFLVVVNYSYGQHKLNPVIQGFGSLFDVPSAKVRADSTMEYKIVIEFRQPIENNKETHQLFEHIGRMYNLHIHDNVPQSRLHVAVVIFGPAAWTVLNNEAYKAKFKTDNPNLKVFEEFKKAGIKTIVCGQSITLHGIDPLTVNSNVEIASSRFTAVSTLQMKGYALFQMD